MKKNSFTIDYPPEAIVSLKETPEEFVQEVKLSAAVKLYEMGRLASGIAAKLAGLSRVEFLLTLKKHHVSPFQISEQELDEESKNV